MTSKVVQVEDAALNFGGTHADHTGQIGIGGLCQSAVTAGIRHIEAVTGCSVWLMRLRKKCDNIAGILKALRRTSDRVLRLARCEGAPRRRLKD